MKATSSGERPRSAGNQRIDRLNQHVRDLADRLPDMIDNATTAYERLAAREMPDDVKSVAAHQAALRSALAHLEALLNLACRLNEPGAGGGPPEDDRTILEHLYSEAAAAVALLPEQAED